MILATPGLSAAHRLSPVEAVAATLSLWCTGHSFQWLLLQSAGSRAWSSVAVAHGLSCSGVCGIFPGQGSNPRPLHWQADSLPLDHQGSPAPLLVAVFFVAVLMLKCPSQRPSTSALSLSILLSRFSVCSVEKKKEKNFSYARVKRSESSVLVCLTSAKITT